MWLEKENGIEADGTVEVEAVSNNVTTAFRVMKLDRVGWEHIRRMREGWEWLWRKFVGGLNDSGQSDQD